MLPNALAKPSHERSWVALPAGVARSSRKLAARYPASVRWSNFALRFSGSKSNRCHEASCARSFRSGAMVAAWERAAARISAPRAQQEPGSQGECREPEGRAPEPLPWPGFQAGEHRAAEQDASAREGGVVLSARFLEV